MIANPQAKFGVLHTRRNNYGSAESPDEKRKMTDKNIIVLQDPVCGMTVTPQSFHRTEHKGHIFFFCGAKCKSRFDARPSQFLVRPVTALPSINEGPVIVGTAMSTATAEKSVSQDFQSRFWWTLVLTAVMIGLAWLGQSQQWMGIDSQTWVVCVLATPLVVWSGWPYFVKAVQSLLRSSDK